VTPRSNRFATGTAAVKADRRARAIEFWRSAEDLFELDGDGNSIVSLYVLAGIAASDALCCAKVGQYSQSENHADALAVLRRAAPELTASLQRLLSRKTEWAYGGSAVSASRIAEARAAATKLVDAARLV